MHASLWYSSSINWYQARNLRDPDNRPPYESTTPPRFPFHPHLQSFLPEPYQGYFATMSTFSSFLPSKLLNINNRDRSSDPLSRLRFALETMPGSRKYEFTPLTRTEIITELYEAFWGTHASHFVPNPSANLPLHTSLHELQQRQGFGGAGKERKPIPGRACGNIFRKGECCFRCRCVTSPVPINHPDLDPP